MIEPATRYSGDLIGYEGAVALESVLRITIEHTIFMYWCTRYDAKQKPVHQVHALEGFVPSPYHAARKLRALRG